MKQKSEQKEYLKVVLMKQESGFENKKKILIYIFKKNNNDDMKMSQNINPDECGHLQKYSITPQQNCQILSRNYRTKKNKESLRFRLIKRQFQSPFLQKKVKQAAQNCQYCK